MIGTFGAERDVSKGRKVKIFSHFDMERKVGNYHQWKREVTRGENTSK